jgi:hypothetical protein
MLKTTISMSAFYEAARGLPPLSGSRDSEHFHFISPTRHTTLTAAQWCTLPHQ